MNTKKNNYNFTVTSPSNDPGYILFQNPEDQKYYFHFNDEKGVPLFFSEGYESASKRNKKWKELKNMQEFPNCLK